MFFFVLMTQSPALKFDKDGLPVDGYAMSLSITGTLLLVLGMLICGRVVDRGSNETVYTLSPGQSQEARAMTMVWLQKQKTVSDQQFESAAVYTGIRRFRAITSSRASEGGGRAGNPNTHSVPVEPTGEADEGQTPDRMLSNSDAKQQQVQHSPRRDDPSRGIQLLTVFGALISILGIGGQFTGLRSMHWLASITQLAATCIMTFLRAVIRRYLSQPTKSERIDLGFEMEWFVMSLGNLDTALWLPKLPDQRSVLERVRDRFFRYDLKILIEKFKGLVPRHASHKAGTSVQSKSFTWVILSGKTSTVQWTQGFKKSKAWRVNNLRNVSGMFQLRRYLGELGNWKGPAYAEALTLSRAIEAILDTFAPYLMNVDDKKGCIWNVQVADAGKESEIIRFHIDWTTEGWQVRTDELDSALSLWLYSVDGVKAEAEHGSFPSERGSWIRDKKAPHRCVQILGLSTGNLTRDLDWWMPNRLEGILEAKRSQTQQPHQTSQSTDDTKSRHKVQTRRTGLSGLRHSLADDATKFYQNSQIGQLFPECTSQQPEHTCWQWQDALPHSFRSKSDILARERISSGPKSNGSGSKEDGTGSEKPIYPFLIVESQDSLENLYAKDLLSCFMWAFASHLKPFAIGRHFKATIKASTTQELPETLAFRSTELSYLVQRIASFGSWTERDVYLCLLPALSSSNNLPGVSAIVDTALEAAAEQERERNWTKAWVAYEWLYRICTRFFLPSSPIVWESLAAIVLFEFRIGNTKVDDLFSNHDAAYRSGNMTTVKKQLAALLSKESTGVLRVRNKIMKLAEVYSRVTPLVLSPGPGEDLESIWDQVEDLRFQPIYASAVDESQGFFNRPVDRRDIFGRSLLHWMMSSDLGSVTIPSPSWLRNPKIFQQAYKSCATYLGHRNEDQTPRLIRILDSAFNDENGSITESDIQEVLVFQARQAQRLLDIGADPNARDRICWTPLHHACEVVLPRRSKRSSKRPTWLESYQISTRSNFKAPVDANSEIVLPSGKTTLPQREDSDHAEASDYAEKFDVANSDDLGTDIRWERRQQDKRTESFYVKLALERVEILLQRNADINAQSLDGSTPLHCAVRSGCGSLVDHLMKKGADETIADCNGHTPFHLAAMANETLLLFKLHPRSILGAETKDTAGRTALHLAAMTDGTDSMDTLFQLPRIRENTPDNNDRTPLHLASLFGNAGATKLLLTRPAVSWNSPDSYGFTPLHLAAMSNSYDVVTLLVGQQKVVFDVWGQHGQVNAIWNSLDNLRRTPFHLAAEHRSDEAIRRIIDGMNKTGFWGSAIANVLAQQDIFGDTALMKAMNSRSLVSAQVLCEYQEDESATDKWDKQFLELKNQDGYTALAIAVSTLFKEGVEYLIERGANMNTECFERKGLLHYAVSAGSWTIADILTRKVDIRLLRGLIDKTDINNQTPLDLATDQGSEWQKWAERCPLPVERQWRLQLAKAASRANRAMGTSILPRIPEDDTLN